MANRLKIVVVNETEFAFAATGETDDFVMDTGTLAPGSDLPPPVIEPKKTCDFTVMTPLGGPGPEGWFRYEFEGLKLRVSINWTDATNTKPGKVTEEDGEKVAAGAVNPCSYEWRLLDGGIGELDSPPVAYTDEKNQPVSVDQLAAFHQRDKMVQAEKDEKGNLLDKFKTLTATFRLRVKNAQANVSPPGATPAVMPKGVVRPTGGSKAVIGTAYRTWNADGLSQRRKKLLAVIGNRFPQIYVPPGGTLSGTDPYRSVPYQRMTSWSPGNGTSCTSINGMVEYILTGAKVSKWAFAAYRFEEAWVPWGANPAKPMPNVGDVYLLYRDIVKDNPKKVTDFSHLRHCGIIVHVPENPGEDWVTADGGQEPGGGGAFLNRRPWEKRKPSQPTPAKQSAWEEKLRAHAFARPIQDTEYPYLGGGAEATGNLADANRLVGWLDLDLIAIRSEAFDPPSTEDLKIRRDNIYSEYDYQFLGAWIDDLLGKRSNALAPWLAHIKDATTNKPPWQPAAPPAASP